MLKELKNKYGELYRRDNVILSGTHTHSGPGGYFQYTLFWITSKGLIKPNLNAIVNGIVKVGVTGMGDTKVHEHRKGRGNAFVTNSCCDVLGSTSKECWGCSTSKSKQPQNHRTVITGQFWVEGALKIIQFQPLP